MKYSSILLTLFLAAAVEGVELDDNGGATVPPPSMPVIQSMPMPKPTLDAGSVITPPENASCWNSTNSINEHEIDLIQNDPDKLQQRRTYQYCGTTTQLGHLVRDEITNKASFQGGQPPLLALAPNLHVMCGDDGSPDGGCVLEGGSMAVYSPPNDGSVGGLEGHTIDATNLTIVGMTFTRQQTKKGSTPVSAVNLMAPGTTMLFHECRWTELGDDETQHPPDTALGLSYNATADDNRGLYSSSLFLRDCSFESNLVDRAVVFTTNVEMPKMGGMTSPMYVSIERTMFDSNEITTTENTNPGMLNFNMDTEVKVAESCFIDNAANMVAVFLEQGNNANLVDNYGEGNSFVSAVDGCSDILKGHGFAKMFPTCQDFSAEQCSIGANLVSPGDNTPVDQFNLQAGGRNGDGEIVDDGDSITVAVVDQNMTDTLEAAKKEAAEALDRSSTGGDGDKDDTGSPGGVGLTPADKPFDLEENLMVPADGSDECWTSTKSIVYSEVSLVETDSELLTNYVRKYIICPGMSITIGTYTGVDEVFVDGDWPILVVAPNLLICCGPDCSKEDECVLAGVPPEMAIYSLTDDKPAGLREVLLPDDYEIDALGLQVKGITIIGPKGGGMDMDSTNDLEMTDLFPVDDEGDEKDESESEERDPSSSAATLGSVVSFAAGVLMVGLAL